MKKIISYVGLILLIVVTVISTASCSALGGSGSSSGKNILGTLFTVNSDKAVFVYDHAGNAMLFSARLCENSVLTVPEKCPLGRPVVAITGGAFHGAPITEVTIPASLTDIQEGAFDSCESLKKITFAEGTTIDTIKKGVFKDCTSLERIDIPDSVTIIDGDTYVSVGGSYEEDLPEFIKYEGAFQGCTSLKEVNFGENSKLECINNKAFDGCTALTNISIPDGVTFIGESAFKNCSSLTNIDFGKGSKLTEIERGAFENCSSLKQFIIPSGVREIIGGTIIDLGRLIIPGGSFLGCTGLESIITYPDSKLSAIEDDAFMDLTGLKTIVLPKGIDLLTARLALKDCASLTHIYYLGGAEDWQGLEETHFNNTDVYFYSEEAPESKGNFWHYIDGMPAAWE